MTDQLEKLRKREPYVPEYILGASFLLYTIALAVVEARHPGFSAVVCSSFEPWIRFLKSTIPSFDALRSAALADGDDANIRFYDLFLTSFWSVALVFAPIFLWRQIRLYFAGINWVRIPPGMSKVQFGLVLLFCWAFVFLLAWTILFPTSIDQAFFEKYYRSKVGLFVIATCDLTAWLVAERVCVITLHFLLALRGREIRTAPPLSSREVERLQRWIGNNLRSLSGFLGLVALIVAIGPIFGIYSETSWFARIAALLVFGLAALAVLLLARFSKRFISQKDANEEKSET